MIYLDANASEPTRPEAVRAATEAMQCVGNPTSIHASGRFARRLLESSRHSIARHLGGDTSGIVFTSGGTEANNLAIAALGEGRRVIRSAVEHDAVRAACPGAIVVPVDCDGVTRLDALASALERSGPSLVCLMLANNETGVVQPVAQAARLCQSAGALLHVDAAQAAGRLPIDIVALGANSLAVSGHKSGGPAGAGALLLNNVVIRDGQMRGGGQELGRRGGTPCLPAIAGFAAALDATEPGYAARVTTLRDRIGAAAEAAGAEVCGGKAERLPNTLCLVLDGVRADLQVIMLDQDGFAVSAGAACSSGKVSASHVLQAMGLGRRAGQAIRVSLPWNIQPSQVDDFIGAYQRMVRRIRTRADA